MASPLRAATTATAPAGGIAIPFELRGGRVWIYAMFNGKGPYAMILDTGTFASIIYEPLAKELSLKSVARNITKGVGGTAEMKYYRVDDVVIGGAVREQGMLLGGLDKSLGPGTDGAFSSGLMTKVDSDLDFTRRELRLYPNGRPNRDGFKKIPARIETGRVGIRDAIGSAHMECSVALDTFETKLGMDSGAPGEVLLSGKGTAMSGLWKNDQPYAPMHSRGLGKRSVPGRLVRIAKMRIGLFGFNGPLVKLQEPGATGSEIDTNGLLGLAAMARLNFSTDIEKKEIWAQPSGIALPENTHPLSGLWIEERGGELEIVDVGTGSPAATAGLKEGDMIIGQAFAPFISKISGVAGDTVAFDYKRGGKAMRAEFTLKPFL